MDIDRLIRRVQKIQNGFLDIQKTADEVIDNNTAKESTDLAMKLYTSEVFQVRCLATFIFGRLAAKSKKILNYLKTNISKDENWRVQEILAKAFDKYCADIGYELALPVIKEWLADINPNVRRAVAEGLRIWTGRPYFQKNPEIAVQLLSQLKADESEFVRKSAGNAIRDISKKHSRLVQIEVHKWDISKKEIHQTYKLASKFL